MVFFSNILDNIHIQILYYVDTDITMSINGKDDITELAVDGIKKD